MKTLSPHISRFRKHWLRAGLFLLALALLLSASPNARAMPHAGYELPWWTVDGGGGAASNGAYVLNGTLAQPDAAVVSQNGYTLEGGFWGVAHNYYLHLPLLRR